MRSDLAHAGSRTIHQIRNATRLVEALPQDGARAHVYALKRYTFTLLHHVTATSTHCECQHPGDPKRKWYECSVHTALSSLGAVEAKSS